MFSQSQEDSLSQLSCFKGKLFSSQLSQIDDEKSQPHDISLIDLDSNSSNYETESKVAKTLFESQNTQSQQANESNDSLSCFPLLQNSLQTPSKRVVSFKEYNNDSDDIIGESPIVDKKVSISQNIASKSGCIGKKSDLYTTKRTKPKTNKPKNTQTKLDIFISPKEASQSDLESSQFPPIKSMKRHFPLFSSQSPSSSSSISRYCTDFDCIITLGQGEYSHVYKCQHKLDKQYYAIKALTISQGKQSLSIQKRLAIQEAQVIALLGSHKHIVSYHTCWQEEGCFYIQLEYCPFGTLKQLMVYNKIYRRLPEDICIFILYQMCISLQYIHSHGYGHMDIKPENIFISSMDTKEGFIYIQPSVSDYNRGSTSQEVLEDNQKDIQESGYIYKEIKEKCNHDESIKQKYHNTKWNFKLGDFGLAYKEGTPGGPREGDTKYRAPELISDTLKSVYPTDIFSLGMVILELRMGESLPPTGPAYSQIRLGKIPSTCDASPFLIDIIKSMIQPVPELRPTADALLSTLQKQYNL
ncbi:hypothetical protein WA158_001350 [Blastocystis sp. Blastoise]